MVNQGQQEKQSYQVFNKICGKECLIPRFQKGSRRACLPTFMHVQFLGVLKLHCIHFITVHSTSTVTEDGKSVLLHLVPRLMLHLLCL